MRLPLFLTILCAGFALLPVASAEEWNKQWSVSGKAELRVEVDDGRVILSGADIKQIEARVFVTGWKIGSDGVQIHERQSGSRVDLEVRVPKYRNWISTGNRSVRVELRVPREIAAQVHTGDGAITADGVRGSLRLRTGDGRIEAVGLDGSLDAETGDGSIRARGRFDVMNLRTGDGGIEAEINPGSKLASSWEVNTGDGHVTLRLPEGLAADLDAHTNDGRIDLDMPLLTSKLGGGNDVRGKLNGGGPALKIRTGDGAIRIARL